MRHRGSVYGLTRIDTGFGHPGKAAIQPQKTCIGMCSGVLGRGGMSQTGHKTHGLFTPGIQADAVDPILHTRSPPVTDKGTKGTTHQQNRPHLQ